MRESKGKVICPFLVLPVTTLEYTRNSCLSPYTSQTNEGNGNKDCLGFPTTARKRYSWEAVFGWTELERAELCILPLW